MKIKMLFVALAMLAVASVSQAQFNAILYVQNPFTTSCDGGDCLPPTCNGVIYWDQNDNGPDALDAPVSVGDGFAQANFNTFPLNGEEILGVCGAFLTDPAFTIVTVTPQPSRYYIVIECGNVRYTSAAFTIMNGLNDYDLTTLPWNCVTTAVPCDEPTLVGIQTVGGRDFLANGPYYQCVRLCAGAVTTICLGPLAADERPHVLVLPGCEHGLVGCNEACPPAQFGYDPAGWVYNPTNGTWCNVVIPGTDGCVCVCLDFIEGVVDVNFSAIAGDSKVNLGWSVGAESDMSRYDVLRRMMGHEFEVIGAVAATNSQSASTYSFVDESADNGTVYEYTLNMVDVNGSVSALGTIASATPSASAAVITEYALHQNYPNPFNPSTNLVFDVVAENNVNLAIYNAMGQEVATLVNGTVAAGRHTVSFDASNLTSGLYFYTVKIGNEFTATKKMLLVK